MAFAHFTDPTPPRARWYAAGVGRPHARAEVHERYERGAQSVSRSGLIRTAMRGRFGLFALLCLVLACNDADRPRPHVLAAAAPQSPVPPEAALTPTPVLGGAAAVAGAAGSGGESVHVPQDSPPTVATPGAARPEGTAWLLEQLRHASSFRARVSAAVALGRTQNARVEAGLIEALRDDHPAVRSASASVLSRFSSHAVEQALSQAQRAEADPTVARALGRAQQTVAAQPDLPTPTPAPAVQGGFYVSVLKPHTQGPLDADLIDRADAAARAAVRRLPGVRLAPAGETAPAAEAVLRAEGRTGYQLDVTLGLLPQAGATRATVNVLVATYPGRSIVGSTRGAATAQGDPQDPALQRVVVEHATDSALADLPRMFAAGGR